MTARDDRPAEVISMTAERSARRRPAPPADRPRCDALTAAGRPCRNHAVEDGRCRVHAGRRTDGPAATTTADPPRRGGGLADVPRRHLEALRDEAGGEGTEPAAATSSEPPHAGRGGGSSAGRGGGSSAGRGTGPSMGRGGDPAWARAADEAERRGWRPAVDGLAMLAELAGDQVFDQVREAAELLRRRLDGDYEVDEYGFDEELTTRVLMPLLRPLHRHYWRVSAHGTTNLPVEGGAMLVANHAGTVPVDALITRLDVFEHTGRHARELAADLVFRTPFVGPLSRKTGATLASGADADRLLGSGELVAVWPEGYKGIGKPFKDRYRLQRFGRGGFAATAVRAGAPIIPTAIVGSEEIYPMLYDLRVLARLLGLPYFPIVPQMLALPMLGPFALLPLPSKWIIEYGEPIDTTALGPQSADDPMAVFDLTDRVRDTIQGMLHRNLLGRRSIFL